MLPSELLTIIGRRHFIAEVRTETAKQALGVVESLARGGISVFEISVAIPGCEEILHHFSTSSEIMVGAGSVLDVRQATEVAKAGARFVVSPILATEILPVCAEYHIAPILGALTPTEIITAQRAGAELVKVFPISAMGGSNYLKSLFRHLTHLSIMVSGGITLENLPEYLALPIRSIALSSTLTPRAMIEQGDWAAMTMIARRFVEMARHWEANMGQAPLRNVPTGQPLLPDTTMSPIQPQFPPTPSIRPGSLPLPEPPTSLPQRPPSSPGLPLPTEPPPFKPWDSKPASPGKGDDWIR